MLGLPDVQVRATCVARGRPGGEDAKAGATGTLGDEVDGKSGPTVLIFRHTPELSLSPEIAQPRVSRTTKSCDQVMRSSRPRHHPLGSFSPVTEILDALKPGIATPRTNA